MGSASWGFVCAPRVCVCASSLRVCLVSACVPRVCVCALCMLGKPSNSDTTFLAPNLPLITIRPFSKSLGLSENQLFRHQSGVSVVVLQLSDGGTVSATLWVTVRVQDDSAEVQRLAWNPQ